MSDELFDLARLRKNWEPGQETTATVLHPALARVAPAREPLAEAREVLAGLEALALIRFPARRAALMAFFGEARSALEAPSRERSPEAKATALATLDRLEELLEVFLLDARPAAR